MLTASVLLTGVSAFAEGGGVHAAGMAATAFVSVIPAASTAENIPVRSLVPLTVESPADGIKQAEFLQALGLFKGTGGDFELDRAMTRAEAAAMLVRLLGAEQEATASLLATPFTDVPDWAAGYVGWLYAKGLTKGVSATKFGASVSVTFRQFATFLSRAATGEDFWKTAGIATEDEARASEGAELFSRSDAVALTVKTLTVPYRTTGTSGGGSEDADVGSPVDTTNASPVDASGDSSDGASGGSSADAGDVPQTMAAHLAATGVISASRLVDAGWGVLPAEYALVSSSGAITVSLAGIEAARSASSGYAAITGGDGLCPLYAWTPGTDGFTASRIHARTLAIESNLETIMVLADGASVPVDGEDFLQDPNTGDVALIGDGRFWTMPASGSDVVEWPLPADTDGVGLRAGFLVTERFTTDAAVIACVNAKTGETTASYDVSESIAGIADGAERAILGWRSDPSLYVAPYGSRRMLSPLECWYGEAGLFGLDLDAGTFRRIADFPVLDYSYWRNDWRPVVLSHSGASTALAGDRLVMINEDGTRRTLLDETVAHGLNILGIEGMDSFMVMKTRADFGEGHVGTAKIRFSCDLGGVGFGGIGFFVDEAVAEEKDGVSAKGLQGWIAAEQARLDALGY